MLKVAYRLSDRKAVLSWVAEDEGTRWLSPFRRTLLDHSEEVIGSCEGYAFGFLSGIRQDTFGF